MLADGSCGPYTPSRKRANPIAPRKFCRANPSRAPPLRRANPSRPSAPPRRPAAPPRRSAAPPHRAPPLPVRRRPPADAEPPLPVRRPTPRRPSPSAAVRRPTPRRPSLSAAVRRPTPAPLPVRRASGAGARSRRSRRRWGRERKEPTTSRARERKEAVAAPRHHRHPRARLRHYDSVIILEADCSTTKLLEVAICQLWSSSAFKLVSEKKRRCRGTDPKHTYGGDGHLRKAKRMEARTGVVPSDLEVYVAGHKGPDPSNPDQLCSQLATERLVQYGQEMVNRYGADCDWRKQPIDPMAVYSSGGGKAHGRYGMLNGIIDSREVRAQKSTQSSQSSGPGVSSAPRRPEQELEVIRLKEAMRQRDEYIAQRDEYYANCLAQQQSLLEKLVQQQGLNLELPILPQPPTPPPPFGSPPAAHVPGSSHGSAHSAHENSGNNNLNEMEGNDG